MRIPTTALALIAAIVLPLASANAMEMSFNTTENYPSAKKPAAAQPTPQQQVIEQTYGGQPVQTGIAPQAGVVTPEGVALAPIAPPAVQPAGQPVGDTLQTRIIGQVQSGNGDQYIGATPSASTDFNGVAPAAGGTVPNSGCGHEVKRATSSGFNE